MNIASVENFLFYFTLETGGYVCGISTAVVSGSSFISSLVYFLAGLFNHPVGWFVILIINIIYFGLLCYASVRLLSATRSKEADKMNLYLKVMVAGIIVALLQIVFFGLAFGVLFGSILWIIVACYFFVCVHSFYKSLGGGPNEFTPI